jgi:hypothetical protein
MSWDQGHCRAGVAAGIDLRLAIRLEFDLVELATSVPRVVDGSLPRVRAGEPSSRRVNCLDIRDPERPWREGRQRRGVRYSSPLRRLATRMECSSEADGFGHF